MKKSLELTPLPGEMLKPKELIELRGTGALTLQDRRVFNTLIQNAWGPRLAEGGHWFEISTGELRDATDRNARLSDTIERLMRTICVVLDDNGQFELRTPLLSSNKIELGTNRGVFRYTFTTELSNLLKDSTVFAKLDLEVMKAFRSKYAFSLYEAIARRSRLRAFMEEFSLEELRELLGVEKGKLPDYKNLNLRAIQPAIDEVNAITPYTVSIVPKKQGRKVIGFVMGWSTKDQNGLKEAYAEMNRHSVGRRSRLDNDIEQLNVGEQQ